MKKIHIYIFVEALKWFLVSVMVLTSVLFMVKSLALVDLVARRGLSFFEGIQIVIYILPTFLAVTVPPSLFVGTLMAFTGFSVDNEYTAMRTSGWGFLYLIRPVILISVVAYFATTTVIFYFLPLGNHSLKAFLFEILQKRINIEMKPRVFHEEFPGYVLYFKNMKKDGRLKNLIVSSHLPGESAKTIVAGEGVFVPNLETLKVHLKMKKGVIHELGATGKGYSTMNFEKFELLIAFPNMENLINKTLVGGVTVNEASVSELLQRIREGKRKGKHRYWDKVVLSRKFSIPFSCLLFGLAGASLGIGGLRSGKFGQYLKGFVVAGIYYFFMMVVQKMGAVGLIYPYLSVWIPNALLAVFTFYLVRLAQRGNPGKVIEFYEYLIEKLKALAESRK